MDSKQIINLANLVSNEAYDLIDNIDDTEYNIPSGSESEIGDTDGEDGIGIVDSEDSDDELPLSVFLNNNHVQSGNSNVTWSRSNIHSIRPPSNFKSACGLADKIQELNSDSCSPSNFFNLSITDTILEHITFQTNVYAEQVYQLTNKR
ncbi:hypothetical protein QE152_g13498 [Popillia japonica]|uniref:PiggyBac transposable element-derived protein domain-containing protein n=1 Tax=Popillia japonica TaxID=7064 RepID=A0AAW1L9F7_POPJA